MQSQITCPACRSQFIGELFQIVDIGRQPELKDMLLSGYLNVVQCPTCGAVTQVGTPLLYHDPEHELFMVHVPLEMNLSHQEQQQVIGQLVRRAMDSLPPEQRRGYMLQPQTVISFQSLMEKVLETEGITPEMMAEQQARVELLQQLLTADKEGVAEIIQGRGDEIDEVFFSLMRALMESSERSGNNDQYLKLVNLQARLYRETDYGRMLERQQQALRAFSREVKQEGGLSPKLLLKHVLANRDDERVVEALVTAGQPAFNYEFFVQLSDRIEKRQKSNRNAEELIALRAKLLNIQQEMERAAREVMADAQNTLKLLLEADDKQTAVRSNMNRIDDMFMMVLSASLAQADQEGNSAQSQALQEIQEVILNEIESRSPPEVRLINHLLEAKSDEEMQTVLDNEAQLVSPELLQLIKSIADQASERGDKRLSDRLDRVQSAIRRRLLT